MQLLQKRGEVVAVTGDGTNDAPALNFADVGLSMGSGTSVAKEASDITLLDDSFASIETAVMWGRSLYKNIQRFVMFQLTINFVALAVVLVGAVIGTTLPLTVTQMLWVNLIMDTFAAMALASLPPSRRVMNEKPRKTSDFIITPRMAKHLLFTSLAFVAILLTMLVMIEKDGDISINGLSNAMCILFNKRIFDELGYDYPYELVRDGEWTFDEFAYLAKKGGNDLNGDGVMNPEDDQFGFNTSEWNGPINILYTGGQKIYDKNEEGRLEVTLYSNKTVEIFDEFFSLMDNEACFLHLTNDPKNYDGPNLFSEGRAMIAGDNLGSAKGFRNMDDDFGIIPYPKFDEDDEYATIVNGHAHLLVVPITVEDVERTGSIIEALCAIGSRDVVPAFYDVSLKTKYARDEESEAMMDIIKDSVVYDIGYVAGGVGGLSSVGRELARSTTHDFASYYAAQESSAQIALEEFNEAYGGIEAD